MPAITLPMLRFDNQPYLIGLQVENPALLGRLAMLDDMPTNQKKKLLELIAIRKFLIDVGGSNARLTRSPTWRTLCTRLAALSKQCDRAGGCGIAKELDLNSDVVQSFKPELVKEQQAMARLARARHARMVVSLAGKKRKHGEVDG